MNSLQNAMKKAGLANDDDIKRVERVKKIEVENVRQQELRSRRAKALDKLPEDVRKTIKRIKYHKLSTHLIEDWAYNFEEARRMHGGKLPMMMELHFTQGIYGILRDTKLV